ncbi:MAG: hypothetical protein IT348_06105, partial [Candidatus Eisenbacteria bacterium]|nr:hypothetical protein [Candidatus Eisenbacteria bacterium]
MTALRAHLPALLIAVASCAVTPSVCPAEPSRAGTAVPVRPGAPADGELRLSRAAMERARGHARGVIEQLEGMDFASGPAFAGADRAAFLLGDAYRETGDTRRHDALVAAGSAWPRTTVFTAWLLARPAVDPSAAPDTAT